MVDCSELRNVYFELVDYFVNRILYILIDEIVREYRIFREKLERVRLGLNGIIF